MPALCSALRRRSPLRFPGTLFRASPVPSFVLHPCSPPRYACTFPHTRLELSPRLPARSQPHGAGAVLRAAPALSPVLRRDTPTLSLTLRRGCTFCCSGAMRSPSLCPGALFVQGRRSFSRCSVAIVSHRSCALLCNGAFHRIVAALSFSPRRRSLSCCASPIAFASPGRSLALRRCTLWRDAGALCCPALVVFFALRRQYLSHCAGAIVFSSPVLSFALRRRYSSRCAGGLFRAPPARLFVDRQDYLCRCARTLFRPSPALFFAHRWCSLSRCAGALPPAPSALSPAPSSPHDTCLGNAQDSPSDVQTQPAHCVSGHRKKGNNSEGDAQKRAPAQHDGDRQRSTKEAAGAARKIARVRCEELRRCTKERSSDAKE